MTNPVFILVMALKEIRRERQYRGLKRYVRNLQRRKPLLNGKEKFILKGAVAYLNRLQADRRARSLGLSEYVPYGERGDKPHRNIMPTDYRVWDRAMDSFHGHTS